MKTKIYLSSLLAIMIATSASAQLAGSKNAIKYKFKNRVYSNNCSIQISINNTSDTADKVNDDVLKQLFAQKLLADNNLTSVNADNATFKLSMSVEQNTTDDGKKRKAICEIKNMLLELPKSGVLLQKTSAANEVKVKEEQTDNEALQKACEKAVKKALSKIISCTEWNKQKPGTTTKDPK